MNSRWKVRIRGCVEVCRRRMIGYSAFFFWSTDVQFKNRITDMLGVETPIVQAPMGWIARSQLASAVCNAGALGIIETSSGELDAVREEITKMRHLTDRPFGVNIAQAFVRDPNICLLYTSPSPRDS